MEKWNEICYLVNRHKKSNSDERFFHNEMENIFEKLGWLRYKGEIRSKQKIRIGSNSSIEPDITLLLNGKNVLVIELKHPNFCSSHNQIEQLTSYMRQLKLDFGLLIDDTLQLYYDEPSDSEKPIKVFETKFAENNEEASKFIELIEKINFDLDKLTYFCENKLEGMIDKNIADEIIKSYVKSGEEKLRVLLIEDLKKNYTENIIETVIKQLNITVKKYELETQTETIENSTPNGNVNNYIKIGKLPIEFIPSDTKVFKELLIQKGFAIEEIHYKNNAVEEKIWKAENFSKNSSLNRNVRSRPNARKGKWKELGIQKIIYIIKD